MSEQTKIAWCDSTVNYWSGCTKVSDGCKHCYAEGLSKRGLPNVGGWGKGAPRRKSKSAVKDALAYNRKPWICRGCGKWFTNDQVGEEKYRCCPECSNESDHYEVRRRRIFSLSLGDWLDDEVPIEWLAEMLDTIRQCDQVTWILCSKRPEKFFCRMGELLIWAKIDLGEPHWIKDWVHGRPPTNIILLWSVCNQPDADRIIPLSLQIPAACRGLSLEPLLGPVDLSTSKKGDVIAPVDWLIIGGESGPNARPCNVDWIRSLVAQGKAAGVATFVKQLGAKPVSDEDVWPYDSPEIKLRDKKGGDPAEWPADLRVQEWPRL